MKFTKYIKGLLATYQSKLWSIIVYLVFGQCWVCKGTEVCRLCKLLAFVPANLI